jgi:hypothetical protein
VAPAKELEGRSWGWASRLGGSPGGIGVSRKQLKCSLLTECERVTLF